jgi:hypothetical protein
MRDYFIAKSKSFEFSAALDESLILSCEECGRTLFSMQVSGVGGTPTAWNVDLLGRLSVNDDWDVLLTHTQSNGLGKLISSPIKQPTMFLKVIVNSVTLSGADAIRVSIMGVN